MQHRMHHQPTIGIAAAAQSRPVAGRRRPERADPLPCQIDAPRNWTAPEDVSRHADGPMGDIAFLARFAFGRY